VFRSSRFNTRAAIEHECHPSHFRSTRQLFSKRVYHQKYECFPNQIGTSKAYVIQTRTVALSVLLCDDLTTASH